MSPIVVVFVFAVVDAESMSLIVVVFGFVVADANLVSEASDLMKAESVSDDSFVALGDSDLMGGDCVFGDSESGSLCVVLTVVKSLADFGVTELGKDGSGVPFKVFGASCLMEGNCVSDASESGSLRVVVFAFAGLVVTELGTDASDVSVLVSSAFDLMGGDSVFDNSESESSMVAIFIIGDVDASSNVDEFVNPFFCVDRDNVPFITSSPEPLILVDHSNININI